MLRDTLHARKCMIERNVTEHHVVETIESADEIAVGDEGEMIASRHFAPYAIRVIYRELETATTLVITVIKTRREITA